MLILMIMNQTEFNSILAPLDHKKKFDLYYYLICS